MAADVGLRSRNLSDVSRGGLNYMTPVLMLSSWKLPGTSKYSSTIVLITLILKYYLFNAAMRVPSEEVKKKLCQRRQWTCP